MGYIVDRNGEAITWLWLASSALPQTGTTAASRRPNESLDRILFFETFEFGCPEVRFSQQNCKIVDSSIKIFMISMRKLRHFVMIFEVKVTNSAVLHVAFFPYEFYSRFLLLQGFTQVQVT